MGAGPASTGAEEGKGFFIHLLSYSFIIEGCDEQIPSQAGRGRMEQVIQQKCPCLATSTIHEKIESNKNSWWLCGQDDRKTLPSGMGT